MVLSEELEQMRIRYAKKPLRDFSLSRPVWLKQTDPISRIFADKQQLLQKGTVHFAHIVQANSILFSMFPQYDCPAAIVYSTAPQISANPEILKEFAFRLYACKNQPPETIPPEWREVARVITDEYDRSEFTFSVPFRGKTADIHFLPILVFRKLLPRRKLCSSLIPILTAPETQTVMILPKRYWTSAFAKAWRQGML